MVAEVTPNYDSQWAAIGALARVLMQRRPTLADHHHLARLVFLQADGDVDAIGTQGYAGGHGMGFRTASFSTAVRFACDCRPAVNALIRDPNAVLGTAGSPEA